MCVFMKVFMKRGVLRSLDQQRDQLLSGWLVQLQSFCLGHLGRQKYRRMKVSLFLSSAGTANVYRSANVGSEMTLCSDVSLYRDSMFSDSK